MWSEYIGLQLIRYSISNAVASTLWLRTSSVANPTTLFQQLPRIVVIIAKKKIKKKKWWIGPRENVTFLEVGGGGDNTFTSFPTFRALHVTMGPWKELKHSTVGKKRLHLLLTSHWRKHFLHYKCRQQTTTVFALLLFVTHRSNKHSHIILIVVEILKDLYPHYHSAIMVVRSPTRSCYLVFNKWACILLCHRFL